MSQNPTESYIPPDQLERIIDNIPELRIRKWIEKDVEMLFRILYWCALRPSEGIYLEKSDFELELKRIRLRDTKTQKLDYANIHPDFLPELEIWIADKPSGRLFEDLTYNTFIRWIFRLGEMLNISAWTLPRSETRELTKGHIFRKSFAKEMLYKKAPINYIAKHLRHTGKDKKRVNLETTTKYLQIDGEAVKDWFESNPIID